MTRLSRPDGRHHRLDAEDVERPPQIIDERGQTELGAHNGIQLTRLSTRSARIVHHV